MNNRGSSLTSWTFGIILVLLMLFILQSEVLDPMNKTYSRDLQTGLNTSGLNDFRNMVPNSDKEIVGGEASQTSDGLTLKSSWTVGLGIYKVISSFISGEFYSNVLTNMMGLPSIIATIATTLSWISLILIIIYIFMKVIP
jgi:uncharacterized membrane protein